MVPPASLAGQTVLTGFSPQELTFICGKHLAAYRGEHYIRTLFPTQAELTIMLFAGVTLAAPNTPMPADMAQQIRVTAQELGRYIQPVQLEGLRTVVKRFIEEGAKANIKRWIGQFTAPDGGPADKLAKRGKKTINGIDVETLDLTGTYLFKPFPMAPKATPKPGYRMLAAIVAGSDAPVFFKLTGPVKTVTAAEAGYEKMLASLKRK